MPPSIFPARLIRVLNVSLGGKMEMKKSVSKLFMLCAALIICSPVCLSQQTSSTVSAPKGWKKINANGLFTFYLPQSEWDTVFAGTEAFYNVSGIGKWRFLFLD